MEKELPKRKPTRLKNYDYSTVGAYFVTICVKDRMQILSDVVKTAPVGDGAPDVPQIKLSPLGKLVEKHLLSSNNIPGVKIDQYVIMPDHIHAIIILPLKEYATPIDVSMSPNKRDVEAPSPTNQILPRVISGFKKFCNKEIGYNIFQRGYYDHIIRDREDYETRRKYIYENPMRWYYKHMIEE